MRTSVEEPSLRVASMVIQRDAPFWVTLNFSELAARTSGAALVQFSCAIPANVLGFAPQSTA